MKLDGARGKDGEISRGQVSKGLRDLLRGGDFILGARSMESLQV